MDDLYRDYILEHYRRPHNFGILDDPDARFEGANPLCGDRITMMLGIRDGVVADVAFTGRGCAISQASASLLTDEIKGKPVVEVEKMTPDDVLDLLGIEISPARLKCALLSLDTVSHALEERAKAGSAAPAADAPAGTRPDDGGQPSRAAAGVAAGLSRRTSPVRPRRIAAHRPAGPDPTAVDRWSIPSQRCEDLLRPDARGPRRDPEVTPPRPTSVGRTPAPRSSTCARTGDGSRARPRAHHVSKSTSSSRSRPSPRPGDAGRPLLRRRVRFAVRRPDAAAMGYQDVVSMSGGFQQWKALGLPWTQPALLSTSRSVATAATS